MVLAEYTASSTFEPAALERASLADAGTEPAAPADVVTTPIAEGAPAQRRWQAAGATVRGAAHVRTGLPNQDAIGWRPAGDAALVLAVSDGHGSAKCFRSQTGAQLAVETALAVFGPLAERSPDGIDPAALQDAAETALWRWRAAVDADLLERPLSAAELERLERKDGPGARRLVEQRPWVAYGATLLIALAAERCVAYFQIGDGDVLAVSEDGEVSRPLAGDPRLFAGETTSLCSHDAVRHVRLAVHALDGEAPLAPALIVLSTDGYANSFRTDADFAQVGSDLLSLVRSEGLDAVGTCLESWLHEASALGSGDDVTVGIISRVAGAERESRG
jgi:hypothetical protein